MADISWVEANDEPNHVEQFRNEKVRVYEATIEPGDATLYHRHSLNTIYVIMFGGTFRSEEPVRQSRSMIFGRSVSTSRRLIWGARRMLTKAGSR